MPTSPKRLESVARMNLGHQPVAIAFLDQPPTDLSRIDRASAAGCGYWKHASEGYAFYTTAEDHHNCTIGAHTHGVLLPPAQAAELQAVVGTMIELKYLKADEVATIPHRARPMAVAAYAPIGQASFDPDVVIFRGNTRQIMLISEAARAAGAFEAGAVMGRPACAMIPQALDSQAGIASVGCIGNRVYTGLGDDELYFAVPGYVLGQTLDQIDTILHANTELEAFHRQRAATLQ
jgi:uncharacterized protein (DUF169 family)